MFYSIVITAVAALTTLATAQNTTLTNPGNVNGTERQSWCRAQLSNCPAICGSDGAFPNSCDAGTLTYQCVCTDGSHPNISDYASTLDSFICQQNVADCVNAHPNDLTGITKCRNTVCGTRNATTNEASSTSSSSSEPTSTGSDSSSGSGSSPTEPAASSTGAGAAQTSSPAVAALNIAKNYGTGALAVGLFAIFGIAL
ncbi:MAG: hypothetical protein M1820_000267 [Bogoriella megaspora]|nr:MAG: hypothetical protein M1820_000267 [Bogoriella megaspora]